MFAVLLLYDASLGVSFATLIHGLNWNNRNSIAVRNGTGTPHRANSAIPQNVPLRHFLLDNNLHSSSLKK